MIEATHSGASKLDPMKYFRPPPDPDSPAMRLIRREQRKILKIQTENKRNKKLKQDT